MPYTKENVPDAIKGLPQHAQEIFIAAFNSAWEQYEGDEEKCNATAWTAVKTKYEKDDSGEWVLRQAQDQENKFLFICKDLDGIVPSEVQVIPYGFHQTPKGDFLCEEESAELVIREFDSHKNDMVLDYEHQTLADVEAPASGWIKKLIDKGKEGIWAVVEWTERAKQYIANREYRYVSPVFLKRLSDNKVVKLINVALTNQPNIDGMTPIVNKDNAPHPPLNLRGGEGGVKKRKEETDMKELLKLLGLAEDANEASAIAAVNKLIAGTQIVANKSILAELALKPDATETEVRSAIMTLKTGTAFIANKSVLEALGLKETAGESEIVGTILAMKQAHSSINALTDENNKLKDEIAKSTAEELVTAAMKAGKITPAQKPWAIDSARRDPEGFKVFVSKAPVVVRLDRITDEEAAGDHIDETQAEMNTLLGVTPESWKKHHKKPA